MLKQQSPLGALRGCRKDISVPTGELKQPPCLQLRPLSLAFHTPHPAAARVHYCHLLHRRQSWVIWACQLKHPEALPPPATERRLAARQVVLRIALVSRAPTPLSPAPPPLLHSSPSARAFCGLAARTLPHTSPLEAHAPRSSSPLPPKTPPAAFRDTNRLTSSPSETARRHLFSGPSSPPLVAAFRALLFLTLLACAFNCCHNVEQWHCQYVSFFFCRSLESCAV